MKQIIDNKLPKTFNSELGAEFADPRIDPRK